MIRVAMVYNRSSRNADPDIQKTTRYHFFMKALPRHPHLDIDFISHYANRLNVKNIVREHDCVLLPDIDLSAKLALKGITDHDIPVIARSSDPHVPLVTDIFQLYADLKVNWSFDQFPPAAFYKYHPAHYRYTWVPYGVEPSLYKTVRPWEERVDDHIAISGILDKPDLMHRLYYRIYKRRRAELSSNYHYKLRTQCSKLPYVIHTQSIYPNQGTDQLPDVLGSFRSAIAATTSYPTIKYMETPAAGCLTFMEVTDRNQAATFGYQDEKTAVFINSSNYKNKFQEYLDSTMDNKWRSIADAGRKYTMENLTNDKAADKVYRLLRTILGEDDSM